METMSISSQLLAMATNDLQPTSNLFQTEEIFSFEDALLGLKLGLNTPQFNENSMLENEPVLCDVLPDVHKESERARGKSEMKSAKRGEDEVTPLILSYLGNQSDLKVSSEVELESKVEERELLSPTPRRLVHDPMKDVSLKDRGDFKLGAEAKVVGPQPEKPSTVPLENFELVSNEFSERIPAFKSEPQRLEIGRSEPRFMRAEVLTSPSLPMDTHLHELFARVSLNRPKESVRKEDGVQADEALSVPLLGTRAKVSDGVVSEERTGNAGSYRGPVSPSVVEVASGNQKKDNPAMGRKTEIAMDLYRPLETKLENVQVQNVSGQNVVRSTESTVNVRDLQKPIESLALQGGGKIKMFLSPPELGEVQIQVSSKGRKIEVEITTTESKSKEVVMENLGELERSLADQDLSLTKLDVKTDHSLNIDLGSSYLFGEGNFRHQNQPQPFFELSKGEPRGNSTVARVSYPASFTDRMATNGSRNSKGRLDFSI